MPDSAIVMVDPLTEAVVGEPPTVEAMLTAPFVLEGGERSREPQRLSVGR